MFTVYLIKLFGVGTLAFVLAFVLALIKCCRAAINVAGLSNVRETLLQNKCHKICHAVTNQDSNQLPKNQASKDCYLSRRETPRRILTIKYVSIL